MCVLLHILLFYFIVFCVDNLDLINVLFLVIYFMVLFPFVSFLFVSCPFAPFTASLKTTRKQYLKIILARHQLKTGRDVGLF